jgi:hypothetical protein
MMLSPDVVVCRRERILQVMVSVAVGTLVGDSFIHLGMHSLALHL